LSAVLAHNSAMATKTQAEELVERLRSRWPDLLAIYCFGSRVSGHVRSDSDLDLAVLPECRLDPVEVWEIASHIASDTGIDVDLVDLRGASTVMQHQVVTTGRRLYAKPLVAELWEAMVLSEKTRLDEARSGLVRDVLARGAVHGR
jgi:predicted nucleotidyltransferase